MTATDQWETLILIALIFDAAILCTWWHRNPQSRLVAVPVMTWMVNCIAFLVVVNMVPRPIDTATVNIWSLILRFHSAVSFGTLFLMLRGAPRP